MACSGSNEPDEHLETPELPKTPNLILRPDAEGELSPDSEENVAGQTNGVFLNFFHELYCRKRTNQEADDSPAMSPSTHEAVLLSSRSFQMTAAEMVGRRLAIIGDDVNERYSSDFGKMMRFLKLRPETAYDGFASIARQLFSDGVINWGRIIILLCFGYRMVISVLQFGFQDMFTKFVSFVVEFVIKEKIARWVADQGGWRAALRYIPESIGWRTMGVIFGVAAVSLLAVICLSRSSQ